MDAILRLGRTSDEQDEDAYATVTPSHGYPGHGSSRGPNQQRGDAPSATTSSNRPSQHRSDRRNKYVSVESSRKSNLLMRLDVVRVVNNSRTTRPVRMRTLEVGNHLLQGSPLSIANFAVGPSRGPQHAASRGSPEPRYEGGAPGLWLPASDEQPVNSIVIVHQPHHRSTQRPRSILRSSTGANAILLDRPNNLHSTPPPKRPLIFTVHDGDDDTL